MGFAQRLKQRTKDIQSRLCIGLDPRLNQFSSLYEASEFLKQVIDQTTPFAAAFKPNIAYFEAEGSRGIELLESILEYLPQEVPVILDAKRSDIGETQRQYAKACFDYWKVDAVTLNPFLGFDSLEPFLDYPNKAVYLLAVTSNAGSADIQKKVSEDRQVFHYVYDLAKRIQQESFPTQAGLVIGLTQQDQSLFEGIPDVPLLLPGLGAQGGQADILESFNGESPWLVNASRAILYPQGNNESHAESAERLTAQIRHFIKSD